MENTSMTTKKIKRCLAIVNLTVTLATLMTTGFVDKTSVFVGSNQVKQASKLIKLAEQ